MCNRVTQHMLSLRVHCLALEYYPIELSNSVDSSYHGKSFSIRLRSAQHSLFPYVLYEPVSHNNSEFYFGNSIVQPIERVWTRKRCSRAKLISIYENYLLLQWLVSLYVWWTGIWRTHKLCTIEHDCVYASLCSRIHKINHIHAINSDFCYIRCCWWRWHRCDGIGLRINTMETLSSEWMSAL